MARDREAYLSYQRQYREAHRPADRPRREVRVAPADDFGAAIVRASERRAAEGDPPVYHRAPMLKLTARGLCDHCGGYPRIEAARVLCANGCARHIERRVTARERALQMRMDSQLSPSSRTARLEDSKRTPPAPVE